MLKARGRDENGNPLVILGLDAENVRRMQDDKPIKVDLADMGLPATTIVIVDASDPAVVEALIGAATRGPRRSQQ